MMDVPRLLARLMVPAARRPLLVVLLTGALAVAGGVLALAQLQPQTSSDTLVGRGTPEYRASADYAKRFGDDAVYVLVREPATKLALTSDLLRLISLEGCLAGSAPQDSEVRGGPQGPCAKLAAMHPAQVVFGPGTFVNESVGQIQDEFTRQQTAASKKAQDASAAARKLAEARGYSAAAQDRVARAAAQAVNNEFQLTYTQLGLRYGLTSIPQINDPRFVAQLVFDGSKPPGTPKSRFAYIFPAKDAGLIQVRLRPNLTTPQRKQAIELIRAAVRMPDWRLPNGRGTYVVTGAPVVVSDLTDSISRSIAVLLGAALVVMLLVLSAVFRARLRLLPLLVAVTATGTTFGLLALLGRSLTIATIAVLPVLIGLAVDYAIQIQSRVQEEQRAGRGVSDAVRAVAATGAPTVLTAAAATAAGFLVLLLSPVPMVRGFGLLLVAGIAIAFGLALTLGTAVLALADPERPRRRRVPGRRAIATLAPSVRGAGELVLDNAFARRGRDAAGRGGRRALALALARPGRVLAVAAGVAVIGWGLGTQAGVESDIQRLVPQDLPALSDLRQLQDATGVGGEVDVVVTSDRLTEPRTFAWMADYQQRVLRRAGYTSARGCGRANLCPALSLPDLFQGGAGRTKAGIEGLLDAVPPYFSQGVITPDRKVASLAFGIRLMSVAEQGRVIDMMRAEINPPAGVGVQLAGLPVLTASANAKASSPLRRAELLLAGLAAVALVLLVALRSARRALLPLIPIALATGWSGLVLFAIRIELNPMSVTLGALVIAISTEFSVLLAERYRRERLGGHAPREALRRTYASTGAAVLASGVTAIAGFAVLVLSDIRMLRDFGAVTVVDLAVSLLGVLFVLPAVLMLDEQGAFDDLAGRARRVRLPRGALSRAKGRRRGAAPATEAHEPAAREPAPA
jgi:uncharacterized protein